MDPSTVSPDPGRPAHLWQMALPLAALVAGLLLFNNWQYAFREPIHEWGDWAANSLFVWDAQHGVLLHGHYSRWGFYHPGPALLDTYALGEGVLYGWLHIVPTPFNGQFVVLIMVMALFYALAVSVFANRLAQGRGGAAFFLPLALLFAVWHYGHAENGGAFYEPWPIFPQILSFLCLLVAAASVAAGGGRELPLVAGAGGWLVHCHVAQPLFVVPLSLLAYAGLLWSCARSQPVAGPRGRWAVLGAGWRAFPRAHVAAAAVLALFILPLLVDALRGEDSNLHRILTHLRTAHEPPKKLARALCYFLTFGSYTGYRPGEMFFGRYSAKGMLDFAALHWRAYACWAGTLLVPPILFAASHRRAGRVADRGGLPPVRSAFVPWFYAILAAAFGLTLVWGMKQDGDMYYYNAFFNYSIYYGLALGLAAAVAVCLQTFIGGPAASAVRGAICAALWLGIGAAVMAEAATFKERAGSLPPDQLQAQNVSQAAAATVPPGGVCYLRWRPWEIWPWAIAVALQLERLGYQVRVDDDLAIMFGKNRTLSGGALDLSQPLVCWRIAPIAQDPTRLERWPVEQNCGIEVQPLSDLDPAGGRIQFAAHGNFADYVVFGWSETTTDWDWSDQREGLMQFRPGPLAANVGGVDMVLDAWSFFKPGSPQPQRVETVFNGVHLETVDLPVATDAPAKARVHIDGTLWREAVARGGVALRLIFPDAKSPFELGLSTDRRPLGGGFRNIGFEPTMRSTPSAPQNSSHTR